MTAPANEVAGIAASADSGLAALMSKLGRDAVAAERILARTDTATRNRALAASAADLRTSAGVILAANQRDLEAARAKGLSAALLDRLLLDDERIAAMAAGAEAIAALPDPVGIVSAQWQRPNGLIIQRVRVPLGVIGIIYESRPNVTCDAGALCLKSGNAAILRGGSDSTASSAAIHACLVEGLVAAGLPGDAIQL
ncbi:MAG: gamma-glutamyl-phosphate reductase, partial [Pseudomonadales bacterium]|nr:gamma-glutamyl-phosphate reductase [Pseudomonadales bacterium]